MTPTPAPREGLSVVELRLPWHRETIGHADIGEIAAQVARDLNFPLAEGLGPNTDATWIVNADNKIVAFVGNGPRQTDNADAIIAAVARLAALPDPGLREKANDELLRAIEQIANENARAHPAFAQISTLAAARLAAPVDPGEDVVQLFQHMAWAESTHNRASCLVCGEARVAASKFSRPGRRPVADHGPLQRRRRMMPDEIGEPESYDEAVQMVHRAFCDPDHELVGEWDRSMADALRRNGYAIVPLDRVGGEGLREAVARALHDLIEDAYEADCDHTLELVRPWQCRAWADRILEAAALVNDEKEPRR